MMAYCVTLKTSNGFRCSCCERQRTSSYWTEDLAEALAELPREFPTETEDGGTVSVVIRDGSTGKDVAESNVRYAPSYQRGDPYKYTGWSLYIDGEAVPGQGVFVNQIIEGRNHGSTGPLKLTDRSWSDIGAELAESRHQADIRKAESEKIEAEKKLARLKGAPHPQTV